MFTGPTYRWSDKLTPIHGRPKGGRIYFQFYTVKTDGAVSNLGPEYEKNVRPKRVPHVNSVVRFVRDRLVVGIPDWFVRHDGRRDGVHIRSGVRRELRVLHVQNLHGHTPFQGHMEMRGSDRRQLYRVRKVRPEHIQKLEENLAARLGRVRDTVRIGFGDLDNFAATAQHDVHGETRRRIAQRLPDKRVEHIFTDIGHGVQ